MLTLRNNTDHIGPAIRRGLMAAARRHFKPGARVLIPTPHKGLFSSLFPVTISSVTDAGAFAHDDQGNQYFIFN